MERELSAFKTQLLLLVVLLFQVGWAQLPPPPPDAPAPVKGEEKPFDPEETKEADLYPEFQLVQPGAEPAESLNIVEAINLAWEQQHDVVEAKGRLRQTQGNVATRRAAIMPNVGVESQYSHVTVNSASGGGGGGSVIVGNTLVGGGGGSNTTDRINSRIGVNQLLFDFGRTRNLILQADLESQSAAADVLAAQNDVALSIKEGLYGLIRAKRLVRVREDDLANRQQQLRLARALYDAGEMAPGDVVRAQSAVTNSVVSLNSARLDAENARQELLQRTGLSPLSSLKFVNSSEPEIELRDVTSLLAKARDNRPDLLSAQRALKSREAGLAAAYALNKPELSTFTGITFQGDLNGQQVPTLTAQLSLSFDIYDGGARAGAVTSAEGLLEASQAQLQRTQLEVERLVGSVLAQLVTAERNVEAARAGVASAREGVRIAQGRYSVALGSLTDVLDAQTAFVQAQVNLTNSWAEVNFARARVRHALATPLEEGFNWVPLESEMLTPASP